MHHSAYRDFREGMLLNHTTHLTTMLKPILHTLMVKLGDEDAIHEPFQFATQSLRVNSDKYNEILASTDLPETCRKCRLWCKNGDAASIHSFSKKVQRDRCQTWPVFQSLANAHFGGAF